MCCCWLCTSLYGDNSPSSNGCIWRDNAPCHKAKVVSDCFFTNISSLCFNGFQQRECIAAQKNEMQKNVQKLCDAIVSTWSKISKKCFQYIVKERLRLFESKGRLSRWICVFSVYVVFLIKCTLSVCIAVWLLNLTLPLIVLFLRIGGSWNLCKGPSFQPGCIALAAFSCLFHVHVLKQCFENRKCSVCVCVSVWIHALISTRVCVLKWKALICLSSPGVNNWPATPFSRWEFRQSKCCAEVSRLEWTFRRGIRGAPQPPNHREKCSQTLESPMLNVSSSASFFHSSRPTFVRLPCRSQHLTFPYFFLLIALFCIPLPLYVSHSLSSGRSSPKIISQPLNTITIQDLCTVKNIQTRTSLWTSLHHLKPCGFLLCIWSVLSVLNPHVVHIS